MKNMPSVVGAVVAPSLGACAPPGEQPGGCPARMTTRGQARVYLVREDDPGFRTIAGKVHGNGEHRRLIADANPGADVEKPHPGQKLKMPALPEGGGR